MISFAAPAGPVSEAKQFHNSRGLKMDQETPPPVCVHQAFYMWNVGERKKRRGQKVKVTKSRTADLHLAST